MTFDVTIFEDDDATPFFGTGDGIGGVLEADFSTDPEHPRPYLLDVRNWSATEIDFPAGSSSLGGITVEVLDKRRDPSDQATGIITSRLRDVVGKRFLLRRRHPTLGLVTAFNAVVQSYTLGQSLEGLVKIAFALRDIRERERLQPLFLSNHVIYGKDAAEGPAIDYGHLPGGGVLIPAVRGQPSIVAAGIPHFIRLDASLGPIFWGLVAAVPQIDPFSLGDLGWPSSGADGRFYYDKFQIRWRPLGSSGEWTTLRNMPRSVYENAGITEHNTVLPDTGGSLFFNASTLYLGSFDLYDLPESGQEIEYQVLAADITEQTPFWWDGGSFGDLLREIYDGEHNPDPGAPLIEYNPEDMAAFQASTPPARFVLREPVNNLREWVEKNIYAPLGYAPAFDAEKRVSPVPWTLPDNATELPIVNADNLVPVGTWEHGADNVLNTVEFTYIREHLEPLKTTVKKAPRFLGFLWRKGADQTITDPNDKRLPWERLVEVKVHDDGIDAASLATFGAKKISYEPVTVRTIAGSDGLPLGGDAQDELGALMARNIRELVLARFAFGAAKFSAEVIAADVSVQDLREGSWVRLRAPWVPSYETGERYVREYFQVVAISDEDPAKRALTLIASAVEDPTDDDDETGTGTSGTDCLEGSAGTRHPATGGATLRLIRGAGRYYLTNACGVELDVELIIVAGGGGGGGAIGGGGGAGGVLGVTTPLAVTLAPGAIIPIDVGAGGAGGPANGEQGEDSVVWLDVGTGDGLDPDTDPAPAALHAIGGGRGSTNSPGSGGSGGGAGAILPTSGGGATGGGAGTAGQGHGGGAGGSSGGIATCRAAVGGGGGSFAGAGTAGQADTEAGSTPGTGGGSFVVPGWGVVLGGGGGGAFHDDPQVLGDLCASGIEEGNPGVAGLGAGGGGGAAGAGSAGSDGGVAIRYIGARLKLQPPDITSTETTDQNQQTICVEGGEWPPGALDGYTVRVDYAVGDVEPSASSGDWRVAGRLEAPGCVTTPPVATGAKVWSRAVAEAPGYLPSTPGDAVSGVTPETPGLLAHAIELENGVATVTWTPNGFCDAVRVRYLLHALDDDTARPLPNATDLAASVGTFTIPDLVGRDLYATVDVECWEDSSYAMQGRTYRLTIQNEAPIIATGDESLDFLADVEYVPQPDEGDLLQRDYDDQWRPHTVEDVIGSYAPGDPDLFLRGDNVWAAPPDQSDWISVVAAADQDVTNDGALNDDAELTFPVASGGVYLYELLLIYSGTDANADFHWGFSFPSAEGFNQYVAARSTADAVMNGQDRYGPTATGLDVTSFGTLAAHGVTVAKMQGMIVLGAAGTFKFRFANGIAAVGRVSRRRAGSVLRYRRLV